MKASKRIGVDARLVSYRRGMGQFVYNILREIVRIAPDYDFIFYVDHTASLQALPSRKGIQAKVLNSRFHPLWEQVILPLSIVNDELDLFYAPANTAPLLLPARTKLIMTIHDVIYLLPKHELPNSPSVRQRLGRIYSRLVVPRAARRAAYITTDSYYSQQDIRHRLGPVTAKMEVIYHAANPVFRPALNPDSLNEVRKRLDLPERFVLALGAIDPRKNTKIVIESFVKARPYLAEPWSLIITGLEEAAHKQFTEQVKSLGAERFVYMLGFISETDLAALYNLAGLLLYPSLYEGFGVPLVEAMSCGTPIVCSNRTSIPEIVGDAALLIDPCDINTIVDAIVLLLNNKSLRDEFSSRCLRRASRFSWQESASVLLRILQETL